MGAEDYIEFKIFSSQLSIMGGFYMVGFKKDYFADVRLEDIFQTKISYINGKLQEMKKRNEKGAFLRVYDGKRWYYCSTTNIKGLDDEISKLYAMAEANPDIYEDETVKKLEVNKGIYIKYKENSVLKVSTEKKDSLLKKYTDILKNSEYLKMWQGTYIDNRCEKHILSSKGADVTFDMERCGIAIDMSFVCGEKTFRDRFQIGREYFYELESGLDELRDFIGRCEDFLINSKPVEPGKYTVILSPEAAGVFAHESFGHKSESDFMVGDETMMKEWALGSTVGSSILSIADCGEFGGSGFVPFDDEGTRARKNYLIKEGKLSGRLHSSKTAACLKEGLTGNARAMSFEYEPIVRMTNTYILPGKETLEELIKGVKEGFLLYSINHGSGMSTFTIAPSISYRIEDGKIKEPVKISVISGTVFEALKNIDGLSDKLELLSFVTGGCGKMDQWPLPVGFGGPYVRVLNMNVQ